MTCRKQQTSLIFEEERLLMNFISIKKASV